MVGGGGNKIVATLRADCKVYPTADGSIAQLANLMNYKIRTEGELIGKSLNTLSVPTTVVDLGKQLLQYARDSDLKGVKNAISRGAPFTSDWLGMSALHFAAMNNQYEICNVLLNGGINKDSKTKVDRTPLHLACFYGNERIVELLLSKNCAINPVDMLRMTPLHWAVEKRHKSIVRLLLKHNADVTLSSKFGKTPIALAVLTEQADLLEELEAARQAQANRKYNEKNEKETSDAVNSIIGLSSDVIEEPEAISKIDADDESTHNSDYAEAKMADLKNIKETGILGDSTINLLKSHGISMMQEEDDASKDLLNTALKNGRQLVLSEGGKLLLNETKKIQNNNNIININNNNNNSNNNNNNKARVPVRIKNEPSLSSAVAHLNKIRPNIISKAKDSPGIGKNKNIRIISLNDFKKLYGTSNLKTMQKIPATLANSHVVRQMAEETKIVQAKLQTNNDATAQDADNSIIEEEANMTNVIQVGRTDSEAEASDTDQPMKQAPKAKGQLPVRIIPARRVEHMGTVQVRQLAPSVKQYGNTNSKAATMPDSKTTAMPFTNASNNNTSGINAVSVTNLNTATTTSTTTTTTTSTSTLSSPSSAVIPLLTTAEICRQLLELRRQNEELRRKFDLAQKEKEEMRQRLERLEELLLVERTDDDYITS